MKPRDLATLLLLAAIWGASFLFIRVAAPVLGPVALMEARVLLASVALVVYALALRRFPELRPRWRAYLILGAINAAAPFTLIATAELTLTASLAAILNATTPLFAAIVAAVWLRERLTGRRALGLVLGLAGVAVLVGWSPLPLNGSVILAVVTSLAAALFYALGGVYSSRASPLALAVGQQLGATAVLLPFVAVRPPVSAPSGAVVLTVLALALLPTAFGYILYFRLIANVGPTKTLTVTFLVPVFGLLWSAIFLRESVGAGTLVGLAIILSSLTLVTGMRPGALRRPALAASRARHAK